MRFLLVRRMGRLLTREYLTYTGGRLLSNAGQWDQPRDLVSAIKHLLCFHRRPLISRTIEPAVDAAGSIGEKSMVG